MKKPNTREINHIQAALERDITNRKAEFAAVRSRFEELQEEVSELEVAHRVLRRYFGNDSLSIIPRLPPYGSETDVRDETIVTNHHASAEPAEPAPGDLFGKSIREAARIVLGEIDSAEYGEIARLALARGYRSHKSGDDGEKITRSFYETMRRNPSDFVQSGAVFRLNLNPPGPDEPPEGGIDRIEADATDRPPVAQEGRTDAESPIPATSEPPSGDPAAPSTVAEKPDPADGPVEREVTIDWGDGTRSAGTILTRRGGIVEVGGSHRYVRAAEYSVIVAIRTPEPS